mmetsp:Transcript_92896/g.266281  ORF Transcript_92896/g.266281 Transcript_92896/m.266281 type:complete len:109 (-) Transcript_92896:309-635(-)
MATTTKASGQSTMKAVLRKIDDKGPGAGLGTTRPSALLKTTFSAVFRGFLNSNVTASDAKDLLPSLLLLLMFVLEQRAEDKPTAANAVHLNGESAMEPISCSGTVPMI